MQKLNYLIRTVYNHSIWSTTDAFIIDKYDFDLLSIKNRIFNTYELSSWNRIRGKLKNCEAHNFKLNSRLHLTYNCTFLSVLSFFSWVLLISFRVFLRPVPPFLFLPSFIHHFYRLGVLWLDHVFATVQLILRRSAWLRALVTNYQLISQTINLHSTCKILTYCVSVVHAARWNGMQILCFTIIVLVTF